MRENETAMQETLARLAGMRKNETGMQETPHPFSRHAGKWGNPAPV
jgi:hypothetical protein